MINEHQLEQQVRVSKMLGVGFVLSITGVAGVGSLVALILGWKARRIINESQGKITGRFMAWWCIVLGAFGVITFPLVYAEIIIEHWK